MSTDVDTHVEQIREHVRTRNQAFRAGDIGAANKAHEQWYRAITSAPEAVRERYWSTPWSRRPAPLFERPRGRTR